MVQPFAVPWLHGGAAAAPAPALSHDLCQRGMLQPHQHGRCSSPALPDPELAEPKGVIQTFGAKGCRREGCYLEHPSKERPVALGITSTNLLSTGASSAELTVCSQPQRD